MDWYYKGGLIVGLIWGALRALGVYGEASRDLDLNFLFAFLLTTGGWSAVFLVVDRVAKFFGWKRAVPSPAAAAGSNPPAPTGELADGPIANATSPLEASTGAKGRRTARRTRR